MSTTKQILHEIADPSGTLPQVHLELAARGYDQNMYTAYADDAPIGEMKLGSVDKGEPFVIQGSSVDERLRGKGYGFAMYLGAAALAYDSGHQLKSDILVSRDAARVWSRLQNRGLARVWEPFQWKAMEEYSHKGRAQFIIPEHLEVLRPSPQKHQSNDDVWDSIDLEK